MDWFLIAFWGTAVLANTLLLGYITLGAVQEYMPRLTTTTRNIIILIWGIIVAVGVVAFYFSAHKAFFLLLPLLPLLTRGFVSLMFPEFMGERLPEEARQRNTYRTVVLGLMGFSFTSLLALTVFDAKIANEATNPKTFFSIYYLLVSFLSFLVVLNLQSYKFYEWLEQVGAILMDAATLSLILAIVKLFESSGYEQSYKILFIALALGVWLLDHLIRLNLDRRMYGDRIEELDGDTNAGTKTRGGCL